MPNTFRLEIEYDGTSFHGWQVQPSDRTIQDEIQKVLKTMTGTKVVVSGSGRTDAGVHALGQVAHFSCRTGISPEKFHDALNKMLPPGIVIKDCCYAEKDFHARFSAKKKTYQYRILNNELPVAVGRQYLWHIRKKLDVSAMQTAANHLVGEHDFKAFEGSGSPRSSTIRTIYQAEFSQKDHLIFFKITANGFLKFMVRNIVGTLKDVGVGKITPDDFYEILISKNRTCAGATAPPHGLFLMNVEY